MRGERAGAVGQIDGVRRAGGARVVGVRPDSRQRLRTWPMLLGLWVLAALAVGVLMWTVTRPLPAVDVAAANDLARTAERSWGRLDTAALDGVGVDYTVVDRAGNVLAARGAPVTDQFAAARARAVSLDVNRGDQTLGRVYVADPSTAAAADRLGFVARVAALAIGAIAAVGTAWLLWLRRRVVAPFGRLQEFAADIAAGRLDAPLRMDRSHLFGAFTESFDLLRAQLTRAREAERAANESKRTLVSQLGHDIRTPLASLGATAELLAVGESDPVRRERLAVVLAKVGQIDALVDELFDANAEQLQALPVAPVPVGTPELRELIHRADATGMVAAIDLPDALVEVDPRRAQQVFDNVLGNAAKYGAAPVTVTGVVEAGLYAVTIRDRGPGVPSDELPRLTAQRFRGANAADAPGFGLGLFTSAWLMERMGGSLTCHNATDGFAVVLEFRCA